MLADQARTILTELLLPRYGELEASAIVRIVFEDAFDHGRAFEEARFGAIQARLIAGEPLQYVLGEADFFGLKFRVNPSVLIPRQETEELVAWVLEDLKNISPLNTIRVLDIGLGSGCIGITLKKKMPAIELFGIEKSPSALKIAIENADILISKYPNIQFLQGDILNRAEWALHSTLDLVVSNPPYIPHSEKNLVPEHVMAHEPSLALFVDDPDPLLFYRAIADFSLEKLRTGGRLFFECNEYNAQEVATLLREKGFATVEIRKDLAGAERMIKAVALTSWPTSA